MPAQKSLRKALPTAKLLGTVASHPSSLPPRFRVFQHPGYEHDGTITPAHLTTHQSVNPPISTALPSSSPPPKKNNQKNHQGAIMTTRQTIASPTPPNVKINSSTPKKFSRKI